MSEPALPPLPPQNTPAEIIDYEHLNLLKIFHYVVGGLECLGCCFESFYVYIGLMLSVMPTPKTGGIFFRG
jgi:hypothetical protein